MENIDLKKITQEIIEFINNISYQNIHKKTGENEFINNKIELLINITSFLSEEEFEENIDLITNNEIELEPCTIQKRELLIYVKNQIKYYLKKIIEQNPNNYPVKMECVKLIEAISIFLETETYNSNIEVLKKHKTKMLTLKKYNDKI